MRTILVPLDGSPLAERVLAYVPLLARTLSAHVQLIHVVSPADSYHLFVDQIEVATALGDLPVMQYASPKRAEDVLSYQAHAYLDKVAAQLQTHDVDISCTVCYGTPVEAIVQEAIDTQATLIALATHGYGGIRRWALGSVADKVIRATTTPVFVVREVAPANEPMLKRLLVPLDGSALARAALPLATELAARSQAELQLFTVLPPPLDEAYSPLHTISLDQTKLHDLVKRELADHDAVLCNQQVTITTRLSFGFPAEAIVNEAIASNADLIVMGTHGYGGVQRWVLGSVADKVLRASPIPLLLVHDQSDKA